MLFLSKTDMQQCYSMQEAIAADKQALKQYSLGKANIPLRVNISAKGFNGQNLYMPGFVEGDIESAAAGIKIVSVYPDNAEKNLPVVPATMVVLNPETGMVSAILDGTYLTQLRTGAVQGAATDLLARPDAEMAALIGTGGQAASQLEAMLCVRNLKQVRIFDIHFERAQEFAKEMSKKFNEVDLLACRTARECVEQADIITTVTTARQATFSADWVKAGAHINGIGAYTPEMCEIPAEILPRASAIIFDTMDGVLGEAGDILQPLAKGIISREDFSGELGQLIAGQISGRKHADDITIFKTVGSAVLDVFVASQIVNRARQMCLGKEVQ